jgi:hypothetical protein
MYFFIQTFLQEQKEKNKYRLRYNNNCYICIANDIICNDKKYYRIICDIKMD